MASSERRRAYQGPAFLSGGFRPFFLLAATCSALAMGLWIVWFTGLIDLPAAFDPFTWHVHEMLFGFGAATVCGFLLTAVPNWTGRLPVTGKPLAALALVWLAGRIVVLLGGGLPPLWVALTDCAFLASLAAIIGREVIAGRNWRNLPVLGLTLLLLAANIGFHIQAMQGEVPYAGWPGRLGIAALVFLVCLIGGRIIPSFTRNWLAQRGPGRLPQPPSRFDAGVLALTGVALWGWIVVPDHLLSGAALVTAGVGHVGRLSRWAGWRALAEPLVAVLHIAYLFVPLGFILLGCSVLDPANVRPAAGLHGWLAGAIGLMTLAVMTRASLGHTGRSLQAGLRELAIYGSVTLAALARTAAGLGGPDWLLHLAAAGWIAGFALYAVFYAPILIGPRLAPRQPSRAPAGA